MALFEEFRRRKVFRVAGLYLIVGWLLMQVANHLEEALNLPGWFDTFVTMVVLIGFPIAVILAWAFELTPEGVKRTDTLDEVNRLEGSKRSNPNYLVVSVLFVLVGVAGWQLSKTVPEVASTTRLLTTDEKSIAVLPFIALSVEKSDSYFGKGIAEELLNALTKFADLKVAARTSAFSFEGQAIDLREIGQKLGVAHILEGSVRSSGNRVRVTAQLIRVEDGFHLWSETYDRNLSELFEVQDEIVGAISRTLQIHLGVGIGNLRAARKQVDPAAYRNYLRALELWGTRSEPKNRQQAIKTIRRVTEQDPNFADGWAAYGVALIYSEPIMSGLSIEQHFEEAGNALEQALVLDPTNARALSGLAVFLLDGGLDAERASGLAARAVEIAPNASLSHYAMAWSLEVLGELQQANLAYERAITLDPLNAVVQRVRALHYNAIIGDYEGVVLAQENCPSCTDDDTWVFANAKFMAARRGGTDAQVRESAQAFRASVLRLASRPDQSSIGQDANYHLVLTEPAFIDWYLGGERPQEDSLAWMSSVSCATCGYELAPILAAVGEYDAAFDVLDTSAPNRHGAIFYILGPIGRDSLPDAFRRDPRFHAFWAREGMSELATIMQSNGMTIGLPLPLNTGND